jgi:hypothetical protein
LETFNREILLDIAKKEAIIDHIARTALARIVGGGALLHHFGNTSGLAKFWEMTEADRKQIWGPPIDPLDAIADFCPKYIHDGQLGRL